MISQITEIHEAHWRIAGRETYCLSVGIPDLLDSNNDEYSVQVWRPRRE